MSTLLDQLLDSRRAAECRAGDVVATRAQRSGPVTPWNPSRRAVARVKAPLPAPTECRHCGGLVKLVENDAIYGMHFGEWPYAYLCQNRQCAAYVGVHPFTGIPLGTLATKEIRAARKRAKDVFNDYWMRRSMSRTAAYEWLARALGIEDVNHCHIGWFDVDQCERVIAAVAATRKAKL